MRMATPSTMSQKRRDLRKGGHVRRRAIDRPSVRADDFAVVHGTRSVNAGGSSRLDAKDRVGGGDRAQLVVGWRRAESLEEASHLEAPAGEVGAQHGRLLRVVDLDRAKGLAPPAQPQLATAGGAQVADPLRLAARRDQVAGAVAFEQV